MTLKDEIHALIDELPDGLPYLRELHESLRMSKAIDEGKADLRAGRSYTAEEALAELGKRWPRKVSA